MTDNAHQESIRLEAGQTAPDFTLPSDTGDTVTLSALRGQEHRPIFLSGGDDTRMYDGSLRFS